MGEGGDMEEGEGAGEGEEGELYIFISKYFILYLQTYTPKVANNGNPPKYKYFSAGTHRGPPVNDRVTRRIHLVDTWSKVVFPASYVMFHVCYWLFYIFYEDDE